MNESPAFPTGELIFTKEPPKDETIKKPVAIKPPTSNTGSQENQDEKNEKKKGSVNMVLNEQGIKFGETPVLISDALSGMKPSGGLFNNQGSSSLFGLNKSTTETEKPNEKKNEGNE